jgi:hypothetical protein
MWYFISRKLKPCSTNEYKNYNQKATTEAFSSQECPHLTYNIHIPENIYYTKVMMIKRYGMNILFDIPSSEAIFNLNDVFSMWGTVLICE